MNNIKAQLSVFFEEPFWIRIYERMEGSKIEACKITLGAEPKDYEIYCFLNEDWGMLKFNPPITGTELVQRKINPKRMQREISHHKRIM